MCLLYGFPFSFRSVEYRIYECLNKCFQMREIAKSFNLFYCGLVKKELLVSLQGNEEYLFNREEKWQHEKNLNVIKSFISEKSTALSVVSTDRQIVSFPLSSLSSDLSFFSSWWVLFPVCFQNSISLFFVTFSSTVMGKRHWVSFTGSNLLETTK